MKFEWGEAKNRANIKKHGFDLADAEEMFRSVLVVDPNSRDDYGEKRWVGLGTVGGRIVYVVFTERDLDTVRIISLRKASHRERKEYEKAIQD